jgi:hypothetical protein
VEFGPVAVVDHLPGVSEGSRWLGTFDREEAVRKETLDFFASGHPLVEGILMELEDGHRGEVALMHIESETEHGTGLAVVVRLGPAVEAVAVDLEGHRRPEWVPYLLEEPGRRRPAAAADWGLVRDEERQAWGQRVRDLLYPLQTEGRLAAVAAFRFVRP